jgi:hypothetical protein
LTDCGSLLSGPFLIWDSTQKHSETISSLITHSPFIIIFSYHLAFYTFCNENRVTELTEDSTNSCRFAHDSFITSFSPFLQNPYSRYPDVFVPQSGQVIKRGSLASVPVAAFQTNILILPLPSCVLLRFHSEKPTPKGCHPLSTRTNDSVLIISCYLLDSLRFKVNSSIWNYILTLLLLFLPMLLLPMCVLVWHCHSELDWARGKEFRSMNHALHYSWCGLIYSAIHILDWISWNDKVIDESQRIRKEIVMA